MTDHLKKIRDELAPKASQTEWDDYQEHLRIGGNKLHVRSFVQLGYNSGFDAASEILMRVIEIQREALGKVRFQIAHGTNLEADRIIFEALNQVNAILEGTKE